MDIFLFDTDIFTLPFCIDTNKRFTNKVVKDVLTIISCLDNMYTYICWKFEIITLFEWGKIVNYYWIEFGIVRSKFFKRGLDIIRSPTFEVVS